MKILMFGWEFPPYMSGGLGTACLGITQALAEEQVEIIFVMPGSQIPDDEQFIRFIGPDILRSEETSSSRKGRDPFLKRITVNSPLTPYLNARTYRIPAETAGSPFTSYEDDLFAEIDRYGHMAGRIAAGETFDVIHSHDWMTVMAARQAREISGKGWIFHVHSLEYDRSGEAVNPEILQMEQTGLEEADHIIAVSDYTKQRIIRYYGISPDKITVIHNGVIWQNELFENKTPLSYDYDAAPEEQPEKQQAEPLREEGKTPIPYGAEQEHEPRRSKTSVPLRTSGKNVLFLGRITFQKGPDYFVEAAAEVLKHVPDASFYIAGVGDMAPAMVERVAELGIGKNVHFTGFLQGEEIEEIFRMSDVYVLPSVSEPFGISPLEAIQHGVPVILSRQSGVSEIIRHCFLVDFWNIHDMADKIIALLCRKALAEEMRANAKEELSKITWQSAAEKIRSLYEQTIHREGA